MIVFEELFFLTFLTALKIIKDKVVRKSEILSILMIKNHNKSKN